jgi:hypothetical protein
MTNLPRPTVVGFVKKPKPFKTEDDEILELMMAVKRPLPFGDARRIAVVSPKEKPNAKSD